MIRLHHMQIAMPSGGEAAARGFYPLLGLREIAKPEGLAARGGLWFACGAQEVHLGVEEPFAPARKAHPGFEVIGFAAVCRRLEEAGFAVTQDDALPGVTRGFVTDPFGNRIEIIAWPRLPRARAG